MDATKLRDKLVGGEDERAVSPVIGVILMVAITVILAAVIAAFVLDLGDSVDQEAQAGVTIDVDSGEDEIQIEVTSLGNSDYVNISGDVRHDDVDAYEDYGDPSDLPDAHAHLSELEVGDSVTLSTEDSADLQIDESEGESGEIESGTVTAVAVVEETDTETTVASEDYDLDWEN